MNQSVDPLAGLLASLENQHARNRVDSILNRQVLIVVRVQLADLNLTGKLIGLFSIMTASSSVKTQSKSEE